MRIYTAMNIKTKYPYIPYMHDGFIVLLGTVVNEDKAAKIHTNHKI